MFVKVFSVTMQKDRDRLSDQIMEYMRCPAHENVSFEMKANLTSDESFHCLTIALIGRENLGAKGAIETGDGTMSRISIFSATKFEDRLRLGATIGSRHEDGEVLVLQSSDRTFHCLTVLVLEP